MNSPGSNQRKWFSVGNLSYDDMPRRERRRNYYVNDQDLKKEDVDLSETLNRLSIAGLCNLSNLNN